MSPSSDAYGIAYTPKTISESGTSSQLTVDNLSEHGVRFVRIQWNDYTNITRCRVIPLAAFRSLLACPRPGVGVVTTVFGLVEVSMAEGFTAIGEYLIVPDMSTLSICHYAPGHASVMGLFQYKQRPNPTASLDLPICPRGMLKRIEMESKAAGVEFLVGIETEFILLDSEDNPVSVAPWASTAKIVTGSVASTVLESVVTSLEESGIEVLMYHAEAAPGQFEIVAGPLTPLKAADAVVLTREAIYNIAAKHGLRATFAPRMFADNCGSAAHAHISLHETRISTSPPRPNPNTNKSTTMTPLERSFLQSLVDYLPSVAAFTLPTSASYSRVADGVWSGGTYSCWGQENRESLVRLTGSPRQHHFEVRCIDGTANPYLALTAILGIGMEGVYEGRELTVQEPPNGEVASALSEEARQKLGITKRMPRTLQQAREMALKEKTVEKVMGQDFLTKYMSVNKLMDDNLNKGEPAETMKKLIHTY